MSATVDISPYLDTRQAAAYVGLSESKLRELAVRRFRIGAKILYLNSDLDELRVPREKQCEQCGHPLSLRGTRARCGRERLSPALVYREDPEPCRMCVALGRAWCATCCHHERASELSQRVLCLMTETKADWFDLVDAALSKEESVVYFVQAECGPVKIGTSTDFEQRIASLRSMSPSPLSVLGVKRGGQTLERKLHEQFGAFRMHGEWFSPDPGMLRELIKISEDVVTLNDATKERVLSLRRESMDIFDHVWREVVFEACKEFRGA